MDMYFESGGDVLLSLDEMLSGGELEALGSSACGDSPWEDWGGTPLALDLSGDPPPGIMVNPNQVIPSTKPSHGNIIHIKKEEPEIKLELDIVEDEEEEHHKMEEEADEEEGEEDEEDDDDEDEDEEEDEEEDAVAHIKVEEEEETSNSRDLWTPLVMKPVNRIVTSQSQAKTIIHESAVMKQRLTHYQLKRSPSQNTGSNGIKTNQISNNNNKQRRETQRATITNYLLSNEYPKPAYSYSCLIAMALKNSATGSLPVSEIYNFMCEHFPYFKSAPAGWKNSVRHNLSLNKCFEKIEKGSTGGGAQRKGCLWAMNPSKVGKMDDEVAKWSKKDPAAIRRAMRYPETLEMLERGDMKIGTVTRSGEEEEEEEEEESDGGGDTEASESQSSRSVTDDDQGSEDEGEVPPSLKPFDSRLNSSLIVADNNLVNDLGVEFSEEMYEELGLLQQVLSNGGDEDLDNLFSTPTKRPRLECVASPIQRHAIASHQ